MVENPVAGITAPGIDHVSVLASYTLAQVLAVWPQVLKLAKSGSFLQ